MKPAPFDYDDPRTVDETLTLLARYGDECKVLAGGQSLVPLMNFRLARPGRLIDINGVDSLAGIKRDNGKLVIGAMTRHVALEHSKEVAATWPLLTEAVGWVGHSQIRNRGTVGGSVAHADPAAELCGALLALGAVFHLRSQRGPRSVAAEAFFRGPMTTVLEADELLCEIEVPAIPAGARSAFVEHARTRGGLALAGAAAVLVAGEYASIAVIGAGPVPFRSHEAEAAFRAGADASEVGALAAAGVVDHYRRALTAELVRRAASR